MRNRFEKPGWFLNPVSLKAAGGPAPGLAAIVAPAFAREITIECSLQAFASFTAAGVCIDIYHTAFWILLIYGLEAVKVLRSAWSNAGSGGDRCACVHVRVQDYLRILVWLVIYDSG